MFCVAQVVADSVGCCRGKCCWASLRRRRQNPRVSGALSGARAARHRTLPASTSSLSHSHLANLSVSPLLSASETERRGRWRRCWASAAPWRPPTARLASQARASSPERVPAPQPNPPCSWPTSPLPPPSCAARHPVRKPPLRLQAAPLLPSQLRPGQASPPPLAAPTQAGQARQAVLDSWPPRPTPWRTKLTIGGGLLLCALVSYLAGSHVVAGVQLIVALVVTLLLLALGWVCALVEQMILARLPASSTLLPCTAFHPCQPYNRALPSFAACS